MRKRVCIKNWHCLRIKLNDANQTVQRLVQVGEIHLVQKSTMRQENSLIVELTSTPDEIKSFEESIKPFDILDSARTGVTAL